MTIPRGPIDAEPLDLWREHRGENAADVGRATLRTALADAGVELGAHDERIADWLGGTWELSTVATIASWVVRAFEAGRETGFCSGLAAAAEVAPEPDQPAAAPDQSATGLTPGGWTAGQLRAALADLAANTPLTVNVPVADGAMVEEYIITGAGFGTVDWGDGTGPKRDMFFGIGCKIPTALDLLRRPDQPAAAPDQPQTSPPDQPADERTTAYRAMTGAVWPAVKAVGDWVDVIRAAAVAQHGTRPERLACDAIYAQALHVQAATSELVAGMNRAGKMRPARRPRVDVDEPDQPASVEQAGELVAAVLAEMRGESDQPAPDQPRPGPQEIPIGTCVRYWTGIREGEGKVSHTRTAVQILGGTPVVWVDGEASCIALTHIEADQPRRVRRLRRDERASLVAQRLTRRRAAAVDEADEPGSPD